MIRVRVSDQSYCWLMPHRMLSVSRAPFGAQSYPTAYHHAGDTFHVPFGAVIRYSTDGRNGPERICVLETPEQVADMVAAAMRFVSVAP